MILGDEASQINTPWTTLVLIAAWVLAFGGWELLSQADQYAVVLGFGYAPADILHASSPAAPAPHAPFWLTPLTSTFLQPDLFQLFGNGLFMWVCGRQVEDSFGRRVFPVYLLAMVLVISIVDLAAFPRSETSRLGASALIAGLMGGYVVLFPHAKFRSLLYVWTRGWYSFRIPAWLAFGLWIALQVALAWSGEEGGLPRVLAGQIAGLASGVGLAYLLHRWGFAATFEVVEEAPAPPPRAAAPPPRRAP